jgi:phage FluMu gp28-like protein
VIQIYPYQQRWVDDRARFKGAVKTARAGFSFGTAVEATLDCLERRTTWTYMSAGDAQAVEFMMEGVGKIKEAMNFTAQIYHEAFADELGKTDLIQHRCDFSDGSRIIALPCNPRTARGYPGHSILDEYAHVKECYGVWAAITRQLALGHKLRVLSTPNGEQNKFFDLAHEVGLTDGIAPAQNPLRDGAWSWHYLTAEMAIAEGCPINMAEQRQLYKGDTDSLMQEFYCIFLKAIGSWLTLELVSAAEDDGATMQLPLSLLQKLQGRRFLGIDFGRSGDRSCAWLDEWIGDIAWARHIEWQHNMPFFVSDAERRAGKMSQVEWLEPLVDLADRVALDATGIGSPMYDYFNAKFPGKVMGVNFGGSVKRMPQGEGAGERGLAESIKIKTAMAVTMKRRMEQHKDRVPRNLDVRQELLAIKREQTGGAVTFDAPRIEMDTPSGGKKKMYSHAEAFWAKAMANLAAEVPTSTFADCAVAGTPVTAGFASMVL